MSATEFKLRRVGDLALVTIDDGQDHTKPTLFGRTAFASLERLLPQLEGGDFAAMVLTGKPHVFAAGADIAEFRPMATRELAIEGSRVGHELFGRIRALPFPTVAAINGACIGGGVELALHCTARTISTAVRHFAAPECLLGIIPAWGGTQLVPRLVGPEVAVRFIVENPMRQNRMLKAREAFELGFADRLLEPLEFIDESIAFARELVANGHVRGQTPDTSEMGDVVRKARARLDDSVHGAAPAPYRALELIEGSAAWTLDEGYRAEEEALGDLLPGPEAQASIYAFNLVELRAKKPRLAAEPRTVEKVGVVGAGLMATQIATLLLQRLRVPLVIRDLDAETVERALASIREEVDPVLGSIVSGATGYDGFGDCDLVLEAVVEDMAVKRQVFGELRKGAPRAVLATNTSSLSVAEMGAEVGIHFFNPVALMPLVELVRHDQTDEAALATAAMVAEKLRKRPVVVKDAPGFVVNRILTRLTRVLMDALEHGNTVEETDEAILRLGLPMAPSVLLQIVGPRVANRVLESMHEAYPDRFPLSPGLAALADGREVEPIGQQRRSIPEITHAALEAMADEIQHLLDEGVVAEPADVDACLLLGAGFPFWLGGITPHLEARGLFQRREIRYSPG